MPDRAVRLQILLNRPFHRQTPALPYEVGEQVWIKMRWQEDAGRAGSWPSSRKVEPRPLTATRGGHAFRRPTPPEKQVSVLLERARLCAIRQEEVSASSDAGRGVFVR